MEQKENVYTFSTVGQFLLLSEEDFKRLIPEFINWHREVKKLGFTEDELRKLKLMWIDDGKVDDVMFVDKIDEFHSEQIWLSRGSKE